MTRTSPPGGDDGTVLVEVLVAFAILIGVITAGFQIFGDGLSRSRQAADSAAGTAESAALLAALPEIRPGITTVQGRDGRDFTVRIRHLRGQREAWAARRPVQAQVYAGRAAAGVPLFDTVILDSEGP